MESAFDRLLRAAIELKPGVVANRSDLAKYLDESPQTITNWQSRGIPASKLYKVAAKVGVSPSWLETGEGDMGTFLYRHNPSVIPPKYIRDYLEDPFGRYEEVKPLLPSAAKSPPVGSAIRTYETVEELDPESYVLVDRYDVQLSAGCGNIQWVVNEKDPISFRARWFQHKRLNPEHCKALYVRGRSMEPKLEDWDTVLIDTSQTDIVDGEIYAVCLDDEFFIKTVERIAGGVLLKSENPDFTNIEVTGECMAMLCIIGKKVWRGG